ncbi:MAG TPA: hypothetical protein DHV86_07215 [Methylophilaceae bacterium]|nr:hypothetical protein [Methylophilaceae bacterium]
MTIEISECSESFIIRLTESRWPLRGEIIWLNDKFFFNVFGSLFYHITIFVIYYVFEIDDQVVR